MLVDRAHAAIKTLGDILKDFNGADPSKDLDSVSNFITQILGIALDVAGILAVIMVLYGAFLYVTSYGEDAKIETAKKTVFWSIIGFAILGFAYTFVKLIEKQIK